MRVEALIFCGALSMCGAPAQIPVSECRVVYTRESWEKAKKDLGDGGAKLTARMTWSGERVDVSKTDPFRQRPGAEIQICTDPK